MGWIYDIEYTKDKKPITVKVGIKNPKEVPGAYVHWVDTKGDFHHEYVAIYTKGALKNRPKSTVHGCLDENRYPILRIGKALASKLVTNYNSFFGKYKRNPTANGFESLEGKSASEKKTIYEKMRRKANHEAIKSVKWTPRKADVKSYVDDAAWQAQLPKELEEKHRLLALLSKRTRERKRELKKEFGELTENDKAYFDNHKKKVTEDIITAPLVERNEAIAAKAEELRHTPGAGVYWDEKTGHLRMGIPKYEMTDSYKRKMAKKRKAAGPKLRAYNFKKFNDAEKPRAKPSVRKASKKELAEIDAEIKAKEKRDKQNKKAAAKMDKVNARQRAAVLNSF